MIVNIPPSLERFCDLVGSGLTKGQRKLVPMLLAGLLLVRGIRSHAAVGRCVRRHQRDRSSVSRLFRRMRFRTLDLYRSAFQRMVGILGGQKSRGRRRWALSIDGVSTRRGGFSKIANAQQFRKKARDKKGTSTKAHTFVMGLLITDKGARIPVPRRTYYTRAYCRKNKKKYRSQQDLATMMIRDLKLPEGIELIVLADEYFEGHKLKECCDELGYTFIVPVDSRRTFDRLPGERSGGSLYNWGRTLSRSDFTHVVLVRGQEQTGSYRRYTPRRAGPKETRRFRVYRDIRDVAKLGKVLVVYSWKGPVYRPRYDARRETFKVLVTNNLALTAGEVVEWYDLRWQIELFFRELKSDLGLADYRGTDFEAFERHVDLVLLSFLSQEWRRECLHKEARARRTRGQLAALRTRGMQRLLEEEAEANDVAYFADCLKTKDGRRELLSILPALRRVG